MLLYIIGFSRSGKSTLATQLAQSLSLPVFDTDAMIEQKCGQSIADIVESKGWDAFRRMEHEILLELGTEMSPLSWSGLVACGGGIVELEANRDFLAKQGLIWLHQSWELLWPRLQASPSAICRGKSEAELKALYHHRNILYKDIMDSCKT
jgi:shikimate kinase